MSDQTIITEDGVHLREGDRAYDYYSMKPGVIGKLTDNFHDGMWFDFHHDDGTTNLLNGQRICSTEFAKGRGFRDA